MKSITLTISRGGVGKTVLTANLAAALAAAGQKVIVVDGDPTFPMRHIFKLALKENDLKLDEVVKKDLDISRSVYPLRQSNLSLVPSGISLEGYFDIDPLRFAQKLQMLECDYLFIDVPVPVGEAAFLSLGICQYFAPIVTQDEFVPCVESAIDTIRLGRFYLKCVPLGFILNKIEDRERFGSALVQDLEKLLEVPCLAVVGADQRVSKSYGGPGAADAFVAYEKFRSSTFANEMDALATRIAEAVRTRKSNKTDVLNFLKQKIEPIKK